MRDTIIIYDTLVLGIELPAARGRRHQSQDRAVLYGPRSTSSASSAKSGSRNARRSRRKASAISSRPSAREFRIPTCAGAASRRRLQLSQSTNSKIVIIGSGKDGLPIILGNVDAPAPSPGGASPSDGDAAPKERSTAAWSGDAVGENAGGRPDETGGETGRRGPARAACLWSPSLPISTPSVPARSPRSPTRTVEEFRRRRSPQGSAAAQPKIGDVQEKPAPDRSEWIRFSVEKRHAESRTSASNERCTQDERRASFDARRLVLMKSASGDWDRLRGCPEIAARAQVPRPHSPQ